MVSRSATKCRLPATLCSDWLHARLPLLIAAVLGAPLLAGGCALLDRDCTAPVAGTVSYYGSSVPPPFHVEWTVTVDGDQGHFEVTPGYGASQRWAAEFRPDPSRVTQACTTLAEADEVDAPPPGSAVVTADLTDGSGAEVKRRTTVTPSSEVYTALKAAVPEATWTSVYGQYEQWSRDQ